MATYLELKAQAEALAQQAEEARLAELDGIIGAMRAQIAEYGITAEQLFGRRRSASSANKGALVEPKYRDPKTGAQWSGRGKAPYWIAGKNRDQFLIPDAK